MKIGVHVLPALLVDVQVLLLFRAGRDGIFGGEGE